MGEPLQGADVRLPVAHHPFPVDTRELGIGGDLGDQTLHDPTQQGGAQELDGSIDQRRQFGARVLDVRLGTDVRDHVEQNSKQKG
jgi:hypothetical protein